MLKPRNTSLTPPGGWSVMLENAGPEIRSHNFTDFIRQIRVRLESNGLDKHGWKDAAIDLMCRQRPDIESDDDEKQPSRVATSDDVKRFFKTIYTTWKEGAQTVPHEEQMRRGDICLTCPSRGHISCFGGCGMLAQMFTDIVIGTKSNPRGDLHKTSCMHCGCDCSLLIMFPLEVLQKVDAEIGFKNGELPAHCWKLQPNIPPNEPADSSPQPPPAGM